MIGRLALAALALTILAIGGQCAMAHNAMGWAYDWSCCSDHDCRPADDGEVVQEGDGWRVVPTGETFDIFHVQFAPDGRYHRCTVIPNDRGSETRCLYVPHPGS